MAKNRYVVIGDGVADPMVCSIAPGDKVTWNPDTDETVVDILFTEASPIVEWRKKKEAKGKPVKGTVHDCAKNGDRFFYTVGSMSKAKPLAQPELIVDGGLSSKKKSAGKKKGRTKR